MPDSVVDPSQPATRAASNSYPDDDVLIRTELFKGRDIKRSGGWNLNWKHIFIYIGWL